MVVAGVIVVSGIGVGVLLGVGVWFGVRFGVVGVSVLFSEGFSVIAGCKKGFVCLRGVIFEGGMSFSQRYLLIFGEWKLPVVSRYSDIS